MSDLASFAGTCRHSAGWGQEITLHLPLLNASGLTQGSSGTWSVNVPVQEENKWWVVEKQAQKYDNNNTLVVLPDTRFRQQA
jgi:hypothetical protein